MSYLDITNIECLCRVCLTQDKSMESLNDPLNLDVTSISILEALQKVMCNKIQNDHGYPENICQWCLGLLKKSYQLTLEFESSQKLLQEYFAESSGDENECARNTCLPESAPVEIIVGTNKYDLKDLLIVENVKSDERHFGGFLNNLGKIVSVEFVDSSKNHSLKKINEEEPVVLIEKINKNDGNNEAIDLYELNYREITNELSEYIITDDVHPVVLIENRTGTEEDIVISEYKTRDTADLNGDIKTGEDEHCFSSVIIDQTKLEDFGLENATSTDQELFKSALNMQLKCEKCNKTYSTKGRYKKHIAVCGERYEIMNDKIAKQILIPTLLCPQCPRLFKERKFLNYHIKTMHNTSYTCEICNITVKNRSKYLYHKLTKHSERRYVCQYCGKKFVTASSLKAHNLNHTNRNDVQCVCPVCGKSFHYKGGLFYHMKQHTNERKYLCDFCDRNFYTLAAKKRHTLTHTGVKPFSCQFCSKMFCSVGEVRKHEYTHTGFQPYHCQFCRKGCTSTFNLKQHLCSHKGNQLCKICNKGFINEEILQYHHQMKHRGHSFIKEETDESS